MVHIFLVLSFPFSYNTAIEISRLTSLHCCHLRFRSHLYFTRFTHSRKIQFKIMWPLLFFFIILVYICFYGETGTRSHTILAGLEINILNRIVEFTEICLLLAPECWDERRTPSYLATYWTFYSSIMLPFQENFLSLYWHFKVIQHFVCPRMQRPPSHSTLAPWVLGLQESVYSAQS